jgi:hypothetical protein
MLKRIIGLSFIIFSYSMNGFSFNLYGAYKKKGQLEKARSLIGHLPERVETIENSSSTSLQDDIEAKNMYSDGLLRVRDMYDLKVKESISLIKDIKEAQKLLADKGEVFVVDVFVKRLEACNERFKEKFTELLVMPSFKKALRDESLVTLIEMRLSSKFNELSSQLDTVRHSLLDLENRISNLHLR